MTPEQANTIAMPIKEQDNFRAIFFIMTICVGKVGYMSAEQLRTLSDRGNAIEVHNYDHPSIKNIMDSLWEMQLGKPKVFLEKITQSLFITLPIQTAFGQKIYHAIKKVWL